MRRISHPSASVVLISGAMRDLHRGYEINSRVSEEKRAFEENSMENFNSFIRYVNEWTSFAQFYVSACDDAV